jgi:branched-chain amino acid transport system ATP-binding protein
MKDDAPPLLSVTNLTVRYGAVEAVRNVDLSVRRGEVVTVLGPNGAGKTTTLEALMGLLPSLGTVRFNGNDVAKWSVADRVRSGLTLVPETRDLFGDMTVLENLQLGAYSRHRSGDRGWGNDLDRVFDTFPRLKERQGQIAGTLSGGERQMLAIGRALMMRPQLLMLDEPSLGLAPMIVVEIFNVIGRLKSEGVAILLVEQNAKAALQLAGRGYVLETGTVAQHASADVLLANPRLVEIYLGVGSRQ